MEINNPTQAGNDAMKIFFLVLITTILFGYLTSCSSGRHLYIQKFHTNYHDKCPTFKNKINSFDI